MNGLLQRNYKKMTIVKVNCKKKNLGATTYGTVTVLKFKTQDFSYLTFKRLELQSDLSIKAFILCYLGEHI